MSEKKEKKVYLIGGVEVTELKEIKMPMMKDHVMSLGKDDVQWLLDTIKSEFPNKEDKNKTHKATFIDIRNAFARKYFVELAPKNTTKTKVLEDTIADLEKFLNS